MSIGKRSAFLLSTVCVAAFGAGLARASDAAVAPPPPSSWLDTLHLGGRIETGATFNPSPSNTGVNFGRLFTDKANQLVLDQFALSLSRDIDPTATGFDVGFRVSGTYGSDSRYTHYLGIGDQATTARNAFDPLELSIEAHAPVLTPQGLDIEAGFFPSPMGYEKIDPTENFFYSKSYIFNFGLPRKHTGLIVTSHVNSFLDLYLGYTTGENASLGIGGGYNDKQPHILGGLGLNFDRLSIVALTHIGPEDPPSLLHPGVDPHTQRRYLNDVVATWKVTDRLTSATELNYVRDDGLNASGGGGAEYLTYLINGRMTAGLRAEVWRDAQGAFVKAFPANLDYVNAESGAPNTAYGGGPATYGALTAGLNIRPGGMPALIQGLTIRPEIRFDRVLAGTGGFGSRPGSARDQITFGVDVVAPLSFSRPRPAPWPESRPAAISEPADDAGDVSAKRIIPWSGSEDARRQPFAADATLVDLRGRGSLDILRDDLTAASLVVDGVLIGTRSAQSINPFDLASIEIAPGASNIVDGDSADGGVITVRRTRPTRAWGLDLAYGVEQGFHANVENLLFNAPVGPSAGLKISASHEGRGGYLNNVYTGDGLYGRRELTTGNLQFDWSITPRLEANLGVTLTHQDGQGAPYALGDALDARLYGLGAGRQTAGLAFNAYGSPYVPGATLPLGEFQTAVDAPQRDLLTSQTYSLDLAYDSPIAKLTSITAFMKQHDHRATDLDGGCAISDIGARPCDVLANPFVGALNTAASSRFDEFTETFGAARDLGDRVNLRVGASYYHEGRGATTSSVSTAAGFHGPVLASNQFFDQSTDRKSGFGALTYAATKRFRLSGEVRYVDEDTTYSQSVNLLAGAVSTQATASAGSQNASRLLSKIDADYAITDDSHLYAFRATGLQSGGLSPGSTLAERIPGQTNYSPLQPAANLSSYGPETATTYEVGSKNSLFGRTLDLDLAGYWNQIQNRQIDQIVLTPGYAPGIDDYVVNLPHVNIKGVDAKLAFRPGFAPGLTLTASGGYQHARITDGRILAARAPANINATAGAAGAIYDLTGAPLPMSPEFTGGVRARYTRAIGPGVANIDVGYRWTSRYAFAEVATQPDYQPAYRLVDLSVSYTYRIYTLSASVRNLTNQIYSSSAQPSLFVHAWGDPRTAVVALRASF